MSDELKKSNDNTLQNGNDNSATVDFENVFTQEKEALDLKDNTQLVGLALSGGGIRSASFAIGVMQALNEGPDQKDKNDSDTNSKFDTETITKTTIQNVPDEIEFKTELKVVNDISEQKVEKQQLKLSKDIHYLSSVSGGGYAALAYTWLRGREDKDKKSTDKEDNEKYDFFPFADDQQRDDITGKKILGYLRHHGNFLVPTEFINVLAGIGVIIRGALYSASFYFSLLVILMMILICSTSSFKFYSTDENSRNSSVIAQFIGGAKDLGVKVHDSVLGLESSNNDCKESCTKTTTSTETVSMNGKKTVTNSKSQSICYEECGNNKSNADVIFDTGIYVFGAFIILIAGCLFLLSIPIYFIARMFMSKYSRELKLTVAGGIFIKAAIIGFIIAIIPLGHWIISGYIGNSGFIGLVTGVATAILQFRKNASKKPLLASFPKTGSISAVIGAAVFLMILLIMVFHVAQWLINHEPLTLGFITPFHAFYIPIIVVLLLSFVNINHSALGRFYRDRLMETFMPNDDAIKDNIWKKNPKADTFDLHALKIKKIIKDKNGDEEKIIKVRTPYNLVNTNIVLKGSDNAKFKSRIGDNFILSPLFSGSDATEYMNTENFMTSSKGIKRGMTIATAMATSGAAVNPSTGAGGQGVTTNRLISVIMTFFNIRLGYWVPNPKADTYFYFFGLSIPTTNLNFHKRANFYRPGITSFMGLDHGEKSGFVELSDGAHFENLGLYELIRRRCKLIIVSDASADPGFTFADLTTALKRVRADFGCDIRFKNEGLDISNLIPGSAITHPPVLGDLFKTAKKGYALGTIDYDNGTKGTLLYIKSTITPGLPADLYGYKAAHPEFPDEPTTDQFFNERQFESYRELGYQITSAALINNTVAEKIEPILDSNNLNKTDVGH